MKIVFCSPKPSSGKTANLMACAFHIAQNYECKSIITHTHYSKSLMESALSSTLYNENGLDRINRLYKSGNLGPKDFKSYSNTVINDRLDFLTGNSIYSEKIFESKISNSIDSILNIANKYYDMVFLDLTYKIEDDIAKKILATADIIVINLCQDIHSIESSCDELSYIKQLNKNTIVLISKYDNRSNLDLKSIKNKYKINVPIYPVPYSVEYLNSINNKKIDKFFENELYIREDDNNFDFFYHVEEVVEMIMDLNDKEFKESKLEKNDIKNKFKKVFRIG